MERKESGKKLYVLVRKDLPKSYRMVQGMHVVAAYVDQVDTSSVYNWKVNGSIICLLAKDEEHLLHVKNYLGETIGITVIEWREPDLNNELTAIAFWDSDNFEAYGLLPLA